MKILSIVAALVLFTGCSDPDPGSDGGGTDTTIDGAGDAGGDGGGTKDGSQGDADTGGDSSVEVDTGPEPFPECSKPSDCESGFCVESPDGLVCTTGCDPNCPTDWECRQVQNDAGDPAFICINPTARLCHPCTEDDDCRAPGVGAGSACIDSGNGSFCGAACGVSGGITCPDGYSCDTSQNVPQCMPDSGQCECNGLAKKLQLETDCSRTNDVGTCGGSRVCLFSGLTECDALAAGDEICNGIDDDCNGAIDDDFVPQPCTVDNEFGACPGEEFCTSGMSECLGPQPKAEACNGVDDDCDGETDEDFTDIDGDGVVDCLDPDIDGDNVPNDLDCAPQDPDVNPNATETCDGKDTNCDSLVDNENAEGCTDYHLDVDGDTHGHPTASTRCFCAPNTALFYTSLNADDCDDTKPLVYPGADEICNGADDDCDDEVDEVSDLAPCTVDNTHGSCVGQSLCVGGVVICNGPTPQPEICNGGDDNCDGIVDEGFVDTDSDQTADCVDDDDDGDNDPDVSDCKPLDPAIHSGAMEVCGNTVDENCNNAVDDEDAMGCQVYYQDADLDTWGSDEAAGRCLCGPLPELYYTVQSQGDCNDLSGAANPTQSEVCNGDDDNCNGQIDEGVQSPCGNCESLCVLEISEGEEFVWDTAANPSSNVVVTNGDLFLQTGQASGTYSQVFTGWPAALAPNKTNWGLFIVDGDFPDGTTVGVKTRVADTAAGLAAAAWNVYGVFPPEEFPLLLNLNGHFLEVEFSLSSSSGNIPSINEVTLVAERAP